MAETERRVDRAVSWAECHRRGWDVLGHFGTFDRRADSAVRVPRVNEEGFERMKSLHN